MDEGKKKAGSLLGIFRRKPVCKPVNNLEMGKMDQDHNKVESSGIFRRKKVWKPVNNVDNEPTWKREQDQQQELVKLEEKKQREQWLEMERSALENHQRQETEMRRQEAQREIEQQLEIVKQGGRPYQGFMKPREWQPTMERLVPGNPWRQEEEKWIQPYKPSLRPLPGFMKPVDDQRDCHVPLLRSSLENQRQEEERKQRRT